MIAILYTTAALKRYEHVISQHISDKDQNTHIMEMKEQQGLRRTTAATYAVISAAQLKLMDSRLIEEVQSNRDEVSKKQEEASAWKRKAEEANLQLLGVPKGDFAREKRLKRRAAEFERRFSEATTDISTLQLLCQHREADRAAEIAVVQQFSENAASKLAVLQHCHQLMQVQHAQQAGSSRLLAASKTEAGPPTMSLTLAELPGQRPGIGKAVNLSQTAVAQDNAMEVGSQTPDHSQQVNRPNQARSTPKESKPKRNFLRIVAQSPGGVSQSFSGQSLERQPKETNPWGDVMLPGQLPDHEATAEPQPERPRTASPRLQYRHPEDPTPASILTGPDIISADSTLRHPNHAFVNLAQESLENLLIFFLTARCPTMFYIRNQQLHLNGVSNILLISGRDETPRNITTRNTKGTTATEVGASLYSKARKIK